MNLESQDVSQLPSRKSLPTRRRRRTQRTRAKAIVAVATLAAGVLFGVAASSARNQPGRLDLDLSGLVKTQQDLVLELEAEVDDMSQEVQLLTDTGLPTAMAVSPKALVLYPIVGPGVAVSLSDAPSDFDLDGQLNVNDLVVHQQDVDAVINALWRGGAEAMSVQGIRITATTPIRCIGNVILIGVRSFAPPYVIEAIGDVNTMVESLMQDPVVVAYRNAANMYQMGWDIEVKDSLRLPPASSSRSATFAVPLENA